MNINENNAYIITCAFLDAAKHSVDFTCTMMRVALVAHGHKDGYDGWIEQEAGHHLTGDEKLPAIDDRARRLLARFAGGDPAGRENLSHGHDCLYPSRRRSCCRCLLGSVPVFVLCRSAVRRL